ncbi:hypothetical protein SHVI106290_18930 [Shewanella violacea]
MQTEKSWTIGIGRQLRSLFQITNVVYPKLYFSAPYVRPPQWWECKGSKLGHWKAFFYCSKLVQFYISKSLFLVLQYFFLQH